MKRLFAALVALAAVLALSVSASAAPTTIAPTSVTASNFYGGCGNESMLGNILPAAAPPGTPSVCYGDYTGGNGSLTVQLAPATGPLTVGEYMLNGARGPITLRLLVNGQQQQQLSAQTSWQGWVTFAPVTVTSSDTVTVQTDVSWHGSGQDRVQNVEGQLEPWSSPDWSQVGAPGSWPTTPIPGTVATDPGTSPQNGAPLSTQVPAEIAGQAAAEAYPNMTGYSEHTYYQASNTPLQPVRLCRAADNCVPSWGVDLWRMFMGLGNNATPNADGTCATNCTYIGGGVPMTSNVQPSPGIDQEAVVCLGGGDSGSPPWTLKNADGTPFVRPDGQNIEGSCWEMWHLQPDPTYNPSLPVSPSNTKYVVAWGDHRTGFMINALAIGSTQATGTEILDPLDGQYCPRTDFGTYHCGYLTDGMLKTWFGPDAGTPGAGDSTTSIAGWGVTAAEIPLFVDVIQNHDCQRVLDGQAASFGHAIGIQLQYTRYPSGNKWWPGGASDGNNSHVAPVEGMRLYWPASVPMPSGISAATQAVFRTGQTYGFVIDDQTGGGPAIQYNADGSYKSGGALNIRYETSTNPGTVTSTCQTLGWPNLSTLPWGQLTLIKEGSETNPNPTG
jgi:hypothetical protein